MANKDAKKTTADPPPPRPPATLKQIREIWEFASELHYTFQSRPTPHTELRDRWDRQFRSVTLALIKVLTRCKVPTLPRVAFGAVWANNVNVVLHRRKGVPDNKIVCDSYPVAVSIANTSYSLHLILRTWSLCIAIMTRWLLPNTCNGRPSEGCSRMTTTRRWASYHSTKSGPSGGWDMLRVRTLVLSSRLVLIVSYRQPGRNTLPSGRHVRDYVR